MLHTFNKCQNAYRIPLLFLLFGGGTIMTGTNYYENLASLDDLLNVVTLIVAGPGPNLINIHLIG